MKCFVCDKQIECPCANEQNIRLKFRSCAYGDIYPRSYFTNINDHTLYVHVCSKYCYKKENKDK